MSWTTVFLLIGFWVLGLVNGYSFGRIVHSLLVYSPAARAALNAT
jgi:hypothetical protein